MTRSSTYGVRAAQTGTRVLGGRTTVELPKRWHIPRIFGWVLEETTQTHDLQTGGKQAAQQSVAAGSGASGEVTRRLLSLWKHSATVLVPHAVLLGIPVAAAGMLSKSGNSCTSICFRDCMSALQLQSLQLSELSQPLTVSGDDSQLAARCAQLHAADCDSE